METVREGGVVLRVPEQPDVGTGAAVFFNPDQELNRDLTVAVLRAYRERATVETYCDAMTASGVRGVRAAAEGLDVTALDVDDEAVELARANFRANDLSGAVRRRDARVELHRSHYDVVDIDPFGTPMPFGDAAIDGTSQLLCVTATDLAPLCGAHFNAGVRRYSAVPRNTEYHGEMGLRILLSALIRTAARADVAATPILSHATRHYVRTYLELDARATAADAAIDRLGHLYHCQDCLHRRSESGLIARPPDRCPNCDADRLLTAGPIWLGPAHETDFVEATSAHLDNEMGAARQAGSLLETLASELDTPTHYDQHRLCKAWGRAAGPMDEFLDALRSAGFAASRTHFGGTTFKTDADVGTIREITP